MVNYSRYINNVVKTGSNVWKMGWAPRGKAIDKLLGNNLGDNFPVVDKLANRNLTSIKSYDLTLKSNSGGNAWFNSLKRDVDTLNKFTERTWNGVTVRKSQYDTKTLQIAIPDVPLTEGHIQSLQRAIDYAKERGINIITTVIK
ncbi:hypothetical protein [Brevibacillus nitrificans]|uniref:endonuclease toxin domain-containing protein n=1 Tax=Brevibacillus nitrificans TaxID=651560 RepID=UPI0037C01756